MFVQTCHWSMEVDEEDSQINWDKLAVCPPKELPRCVSWKSWIGQRDELITKFFCATVNTL
jgi:hypothetical protein